MAKKNYTVEQGITKLREIEVLCGQGKTIGEVARQSEITEQIYYRWRKEYGGMNTSYAKKLKEREKDKAIFTKLVADMSLNNAILKYIDLKLL